MFLKIQTCKILTCQR